MKFIQEADTELYHRADRFEVLDPIRSVGLYRDADGALKEITFEPSRFDPQRRCRPVPAGVLPALPREHRPG